MMSRRFELRAPAKLNLTLEVVERLPSGYHRIRSVFVKLHGLADNVVVDVEVPGDGITIDSSSPEVPCDESNLAHRAASRYLAGIGVRAGVHVHIDKVVPVAAGLGGGSSDAAAVLLVLNRCFDERVARADLARIGAAIGKDVPFFLQNADAAFVSGTGEVIEALPALPRLHLLIVNPGVAVATGEAYRALSNELWFMSDAHRSNISQRMVGAISQRDVRVVAGALYNDFEAVVQARHPIIGHIKQAALAFGALGALMSGSGSTVFGLFDGDDALETARAAIADRFPEFFVATA